MIEFMAGYIRKSFLKEVTLTACLLLSNVGCNSKAPISQTSPRSEVLVLRVESPSPEKPGAEFCDNEGQNCKPIAPQQKLTNNGIVRTYAGGRVTLQLQSGRTIDLAPLSETRLGDNKVELKLGHFSLHSTPLIQGEPLHFKAGKKDLTLRESIPSSANVSIDETGAILTVNRGMIDGLGLTGDGPSTIQNGRSIRLTNAQAFQVDRAGLELPAVIPVLPEVVDNGGFLDKNRILPPRGFGAMSARRPNSQEIRGGVLLKKHHVTVTIRDGFARTVVEEEFENTTPHLLEGKYKFPVPSNASLSRLALWVGENLIEGELVEKERAAAIYSSIVDRPVPRDPALLEWTTSGEMSLKVFPILPQKTRRVVLAYNQSLSKAGGLLRYIYPLSLGEQRENTMGDFSIEVNISDQRDTISAVRVPGYDAQIEKAGDWHRATFMASSFTPHDDFVVVAETSKTVLDGNQGPQADISTYISAWGESSHDELQSRLSFSKTSSKRKGFFALRVQVNLPPGVERPAARAIHRALIVDVSQSQSNKTIRTQAALAYSILHEMENNENFSLLACDSACQILKFGGNGALSRKDRLAEARQWLSQLSQGGSSDIAGALTAAHRSLSGRTENFQSRNQIIYLGDGHASSGELSAEKIAQRCAPLLKDKALDVHFVAVGRRVDETRLRGLAIRLNGTFELYQSGISLGARNQEITVNLRRPLLKNASLKLPPSLRVQQLKLSSKKHGSALPLPALRLGQEFIVTGEVLEVEEGICELNGELDQQSYGLQFSLSHQIGNEVQNPLIARLWAHDRIAGLLHQESSPALRNEIIEVSKKYRTMSPYTSYLVLENDEMYAKFGVIRSEVSKRDRKDKSLLQQFSKRHTVNVRPGLRSFKELEVRGDKDVFRQQTGPTKRGKAKRSSSGGQLAPSSKAPPEASASGQRSPDLSAGGHRDRTFDLGPTMDELQRRSKKRGSKELFSTSPPRLGRSSMTPGRRPKKPIVSRRARRRARLNFTEADSAWRTWGQANLTNLAESLKENSKSRMNHEALIRGQLVHGRFHEAYQSAHRFIELDPDYAPARKLLAYSAVVDGIHEMAQKMLDVQTEAAPYDLLAHAESARSFEAVGDSVRACAHYRSLAELAPGLIEAQNRAKNCWLGILGSDNPVGLSGKDSWSQLKILVECTPATPVHECPSPVVIAPHGRVISPWTPGAARSGRQEVNLLRIRTGSYYVMVMGGSPSAAGKIRLIGRKESKSFAFEGGALQTIAKVQVRYW